MRKTLQNLRITILQHQEVVLLLLTRLLPLPHLLHTRRKLKNQLVYQNQKFPSPVQLLMEIALLPVLLQENWLKIIMLVI
jgi:hypothetical protein